MRTKTEVLEDLKLMLRDVFVAKASGQSYARLARAHGYVDGYMRALLDLNVASKDELLQHVSAQREHSGGPAIRTLDARDEAEGGQDAVCAA